MLINLVYIHTRQEKTFLTAVYNICTALPIREAPDLKAASPPSLFWFLIMPRVFPKIPESGWTPLVVRQVPCRHRRTQRSFKKWIMGRRG